MNSISLFAQFQSTSISVCENDKIKKNCINSFDIGVDRVQNSVC